VSQSNLQKGPGKETCSGTACRAGIEELYNPSQVAGSLYERERIGFPFKDILLLK
jgi:hypothetical protein